MNICARLEELWTSDHPTFEGQYCRFADIDFCPAGAATTPTDLGRWRKPRALRRQRPWRTAGTIGSNPRFPMGTPARHATGIERFAAYARETGRNASELDIVYLPMTTRYTAMAMRRQGYHTTAIRLSALRPRLPWTSGITKALGVGYLVVDFARMSRTLEEMLQHMEAMATQVWPRVEAGEE